VGHNTGHQLKRGPLRRAFDESQIGKDKISRGEAMLYFVQGIRPQILAVPMYDDIHDFI
jgi:hypothetical protein